LYTAETRNQLNGSDENISEKNAAIVDDRKTKSSPLCVADVMTRHVVTLSPHNTFSDIVSLMAKHNFRHYLVVEAPRRLVGVISDRDVLRALTRTPDWNAGHADDLMSRDVIALIPNTSLSRATAIMLSKRINCLPIIDDYGNVCGIITSTDLLKAYRAIQESLEKENAIDTSKQETNFRAGKKVAEI